MNSRTVFLLVIMNGFVAFIWFRAYQQGTSLAHMVPLAVLSILAVNAAVILGSKLGEVRARRIMDRRAGRK